MGLPLVSEFWLFGRLCLEGRVPKEIEGRPPVYATSHGDTSSDDEIASASNLHSTEPF